MKGDLTTCLYILIGIFFSGIFGTTRQNEIHNGITAKLECNLTDKPELLNQMINVTQEFGDNFEKVAEELNKLASNKENNTRSVILIGNTGAGKSTLAQLLTNGENLQSIEVSPFEYIISDGDKIGIETIVSKTLYPNLIIDRETGVIICDSPGFKDTRSPIHELVAAFSMKNVVKQMKNVKIVLVINHASLKKGSYREDFTNLLEQTVDYVNDIDKYKDSFYLVATKAENTIEMVADTFKLASDESMINGIYHFLKEAKSSLEQSSSRMSDKAPQMIKLIDCFLRLNKPALGVPENIKIFRKPNTNGALMKIDRIQREQLAIRNMLLGKENFTEKSDSDFGYSISATAKLYTNEIFSFCNKFMISLSNQIAKYLIKYYENALDKIDDVGRRLKTANDIKSEVIQFGVDLGKSQRPSDFADEVVKFTTLNNISYGCNLNLKNLTILNNYIIYLKDFSDINRPVENKWNSSIKLLVDFLGTEIESNNLLDDVSLALSEYDFQKSKEEIRSTINQWEKEDALQNAINEKTFTPFLKKIKLYNNYKSLKPNNYTMKTLNRAVTLLVNSGIKITCKDKTLRVVGYIIKISDIDDSQFKSCNEFRNLVIFAMDTLFIDRDLKKEELAGKQVLIVARIWHTIGTRTISVDGKSGKYLYQPRADIGKVGKNGKNGGNGGIFIGFSERFENPNSLFISANGGDGQDGQDGGDGLDGYDGRDGAYYSSRLSDDSRGIYVFYNNYQERTVYEGTSGSRGGNSGAGGRGGLPGNKGSVTLFGPTQLSSSGINGVSVEVKDGARGNDGAHGKPGKGGMGGCDVVYTYKTHYALFIPVSKSKDVSRGSCFGRNLDGSLISNTNYFRWSLTSDIPLQPFEKCQVMSDYESTYEKEYKALRYNDLTTNFINETKC